MSEGVILSGRHSSAKTIIPTYNKAKQKTQTTAKSQTNKQKPQNKTIKTTNKMNQETKTKQENRHKTP